MEDPSDLAPIRPTCLHCGCECGSLLSSAGLCRECSMVRVFLAAAAIHVSHPHCRAQAVIVADEVMAALRKTPAQVAEEA